MKHSHGLDIPTALEDVCDPRRMALLVYDMQVGICSQIKTGSQTVAQISRVLSAVRGTGMRVVFTRHLSLPKAWMGMMQFRTAMAWQQKDEPDSVAPTAAGAPSASAAPVSTTRREMRWQLLLSLFISTPITLSTRANPVLRSRPSLIISFISR